LICRNVKFARTSVHTIHENADGIKENVTSGNKVFVQQDYHSPLGKKKRAKNYGCHIFIELDINK
jgi:hypothetical protein